MVRINKRKTDWIPIFGQEVFVFWGFQVGGGYNNYC